MSCDMNLRSMELMIAQIREQTSESEWQWIVSQTE